MSNSNSNSTRCAGCKYLRRRCSEDCMLAPYFPANNPERFSCVHKIFGANNVTKNLERVRSHVRSVAAGCMSFEANVRIQDPIYGCTGIISQLQQQIIQTQHEVLKIQGEIMMHKALEQLFPLQFNPLVPNEFEDQEQFQFDDHQQEFANFQN